MVGMMKPNTPAYQYPVPPSLPEPVHQEQLIALPLDADQPRVWRFLWQEPFPIHHRRRGGATEDLRTNGDVNFVHEAKSEQSPIQRRSPFAEQAFHPPLTAQDR